MASFVEAMKLAKIRAEDKTSSKRLKEILEIVKKHDLRQELTPKKAVAALEDMGPTFVKLGQIASSHPDVLPPEYCEAFAALRANVAPMSFDVVRQQIESELGRPVEEVFSQLDETPLGSASIAQVHKAVLLDGGATVAVKVQRPGIVEQVAQDLTLLRRVLATVELLAPSDGQISLKELVEELERTSAEELDFTVEAGNLARFYDNNAPRAGITSPKAYPQVSTSAVLVMDFASGPRVGDASVLSQLSQERRDELGRLLAANYVQQIVEDGFFHADPHAGNILITGEGEGLEWIDFGMMGALNSQERAVISEMMVAIAKQDSYGLKRSLLKVVSVKGAVDHAALLSMCDGLIQKYCAVDLESFDTAALLQDMMNSMQGVGCEFPPGFISLGRGLVTLEGTIHMLSGSVSVVGVIMDTMREGFSVSRLADKARTMAMRSVDGVEAMAELPSKANDTLDMLQKGQVKVGLNLGMDKVSRTELVSAIDHFTLAVVAAALFIGSCVLCLSNLEPRVLGVPVLGLLGFACGLGIAVYVFVKMRLDSKRRK